MSAEPKFPTMVPPQNAELTIRMRMGGGIRTPDQVVAAVTESFAQRYPNAGRNPINELPGIPANIIYDANGIDVGEWLIQGV